VHIFSSWNAFNVPCYTSHFQTIPSVIPYIWKKVKTEKLLLQIWNITSHAEHDSYTRIEKQESSSISKEINGVVPASGDAGIINAKPSDVMEPCCPTASHILI
jgi:hypothetical protein